MSLIIAIDSCDGAGKGTQLNLLKEKIEALGLSVLCTTKIGSQHHPVTTALRDIALNNQYELSPYALQIIFAVNSLIHQEEVINKTGKDYDIILVDRSYLSFYAYGLNFVKDSTYMSLLYDFIGFNRPEDLIIYLDIEPEIARERLMQREPEKFQNGGIDKIELLGIDFQKNVKAVFQEMINSKKYNVVPIDVNNKSIEETHQAIIDSQAWQIIQQYNTYIQTTKYMNNKVIAEEIK